MSLYEILSANCVRKCMEISLKNLYVDVGDRRVNSLTCEYLGVGPLGQLILLLQTAFE